MTPKRIFGFLIILSIALEQSSSFKIQSQSESTKGSFLWKIGTNPPSYLFGSAHVPYKKVWDSVPETSKDAFESAERIFFELDLTDQNTLSTLDACQYLPDNQDLTQIFPAYLISSIKHHLDKVKQDLPEWMYQDPSATEQLYSDSKFSTLTEGWERKRPIWVSLLLTTTLTQGYFSKDGPPSSALDLYMIEEAKKRGKEVGAI